MEQEEEGGVTDSVTSTWLQPALPWNALGVTGWSFHYINCFSPCRDLICITKGSLGVLESQNSKCCNIVNECSYRIMRVFRMAASTLEHRFSVPNFISVLEKNQRESLEGRT